MSRHMTQAEKEISIHASRGGSDLQAKMEKDKALGFQSTLPAGEATIVSTHRSAFD